MTDPPDRRILIAGDIIAPPAPCHFTACLAGEPVVQSRILVQFLGAAWTMTEMTSSADKVALVVTALMLPVMLISLPAGAIADMYDRRIVALIALSIALCGATVLTALDWLGLTMPNLLLMPCFVIGSGMALMGPAWQSSVTEQAPPEALPAAAALNGISYKAARSFAPGPGGIVVASAGAVAAYAFNAVLFLPLIVALFFWRRVAEPSRFPREQLSRAIISGVRYVTNPPSIKIVLSRAMVRGLIGGSIPALIPLAARDLLGGGAQT
ncbi:MFS family permease [Bradyrhizobium sp. USDA 4509]